MNSCFPLTLSCDFYQIFIISDSQPLLLHIYITNDLLLRRRRPLGKMVGPELRTKKLLASRHSTHPVLSLSIIFENAFPYQPIIMFFISQMMVLKGPLFDICEGYVTMFLRNQSFGFSLVVSAHLTTPGFSVDKNSAYFCTVLHLGVLIFCSQQVSGPIIQFLCKTIM